MSLVKSTLELIFKEHLISDEILTTILDIVNEKYSEEQRYYHTLDHIIELLEFSNKEIDNIIDSTCVNLAIIFHDIEYDPKSKLNEEISAEIFQGLFKDLLPIELINKVVFYIIATKEHSVLDSNDNDLKLFIDFDMSALGRVKDKYIEYATQIRKEYIFIDKKVYCNARAQFLNKFVKETPFIYASLKYRSILESQARLNIECECSLLESGATFGENI